MEQASFVPKKSQRHLVGSRGLILDPFQHYSGVYIMFSSISWSSDCTSNAPRTIPGLPCKGWAEKFMTNLAASDRGMPWLGKSIPWPHNCHIVLIATMFCCFVFFCFFWVFLGCFWNRDLLEQREGGEERVVDLHLVSGCTSDDLVLL